MAVKVTGIIAPFKNYTDLIGFKLGRNGERFNRGNSGGIDFKLEYFNDVFCGVNLDGIFSGNELNGAVTHGIGYGGKYNRVVLTNADVGKGYSAAGGCTDNTYHILILLIFGLCVFENGIDSMSGGIGEITFFVNCDFKYAVLVNEADIFAYRAVVFLRNLACSESRKLGGVDLIAGVHSAKNNTEIGHGNVVGPCGIVRNLFRLVNRLCVSVVVEIQHAGEGSEINAVVSGRKGKSGAVKAHLVVVVSIICNDLTEIIADDYTAVLIGLGVQTALGILVSREMKIVQFFELIGIGSCHSVAEKKL